MVFERRRSFASLVGLAALGFSFVAGAEPTSNEKDTARELNNKGRAAAEAGKHAEALVYFRQADEIVHLPITGINVARALAATGKLVEARDVALATTLIPPQPGEATLQATSRDDARRLASELTERIPVVEITAEGPAPKDVTVIVQGAVSRGGVSVGRRLDPGTYEIELRAAGYAPTKLTVTLVERDRRSERVVMRRATVTRPVAPPSARGGADESTSNEGPLAVFVTGAVLAGCGLAVGAGTGIASISTTNDLEEVCDGGFCPSSSHDDLARANDLAVASDVSFIVAAVGGALTIAGGVWLAVRSGERESDSETEGAVVGVGPGGLYLRGRFR